MNHLKVIIQSWGNDFAVRIPKKLADSYDLQQGKKVEWVESKDGLCLKLTDDKPTLEELLAKCTDENRHEYIDFGRSGRELL